MCGRLECDYKNYKIIKKKGGGFVFCIFVKYLQKPSVIYFIVNGYDGASQSVSSVSSVNSVSSVPSRPR